MRPMLFQAGGALEGHSPAYIVRAANQNALDQLLLMNYITLVEPRQQGKTSLINWLISELQSKDYLFAYIDLSTLDAQDEGRWYRSLASIIAQQLRSIINEEVVQLLRDGSSWLDFLMALARKGEHFQKNIVIALDEVGAAKLLWARQFFSVIRSIYNSRQNIPILKRITFIVSGAYNPKELIDDPVISNFNVDHRIFVSDFDQDQVKELVSNIQIGDPEDGVASRIYYWTSGQPYITQKICAYLVQDAQPITTSAVDQAVNKFLVEDTNHLSRIKRDLDSTPELREYARHILRKRTKYIPSVNDWQFKLAHVIGLISSDSSGNCRIRNQIYQSAFPDLSKKTINLGPQKLAYFKGASLFLLVEIIIGLLLFLGLFPLLNPVNRSFINLTSPGAALGLESGLFVLVFWLALHLLKWLDLKLNIPFLEFNSPDQSRWNEIQYYLIRTPAWLLIVLAAVPSLLLSRMDIPCNEPTVVFRVPNSENFVLPDETISLDESSLLIVSATVPDKSNEILKCKWIPSNSSSIRVNHSFSCTTEVRLDSLEGQGLLTVEVTRDFCSQKKRASINIASLP